jgi:FtsZ-binding cell division protein ZapB
MMRKSKVQEAEIPKRRVQPEVISRLEQRLSGLMDEIKSMQMDLAELKGAMNLDEVEHHQA